MDFRSLDASKSVERYTAIPIQLNRFVEHPGKTTLVEPFFSRAKPVSECDEPEERGHGAFAIWGAGDHPLPAGGRLFGLVERRTKNAVYNTGTNSMQQQGGITITAEQEEGVVSLHGLWREAGPRLRVDDAVTELRQVRRVRFETSALGSWDSRLAVFVSSLVEALEGRDVAVDSEGLPQGMRRLMALAAQGRSSESDLDASPKTSFLLRVGLSAVSMWVAFLDFLAFIGEVSIGLGRVLVGKGRFRSDDFFLLLQSCGPSALPIVSLISLVIGVIFAFVGSVQLQMFGAQIYVADIVGIGMAREMGAMMAGIIMAGRTGAAFAAQLGTMQVNEEVDALITMGLNPAEFLVVPRMIALVLMMPLLCLYAIFLGIGGGMAIGVGMLDISWAQYWYQTQEALNITQFMHGILKSGLYGVIIALAGCYHGMRCGRSASDVGDAATKAVVSAIVGIIIADGLIAVVTSILGI